MTLKEKVQARREAVLEIAARYGVSNVRIFGSLARGDERERSDLDLLVSLAQRRGLLDLIGFKQDVEELLGARVDVVEDAGLSPFMKNRILEEAKPL